MVTKTITGYDAMGRQLAEQKTINGNATAYTTAYTYDLSGKIVGMTYPDNYQLTYSFYPGTDLLYQVKGMTDNVEYATYSLYEPTGKIGQISYANGTATRYTYDALSSMLTGIVTAAPSGLSENDLQRKTYLYSKAGDMKSIRDSHKGVNYTYTYDKLHRLLGETNDGTYAFNGHTYDAVGNILTKTLGASTYTYSYNGTHKHAVSSISYNNDTRNYSYDANGNMLIGPDFTDTAVTGNRAMTYNADNMPTRVVYTKNGNTVISDFVYDHANIRSLKTVTGGSTTYYVNPYYEIKDDVVTKYVIGAKTKIAVLSGSDTYYFAQDHLGSSAVMTSAGGVKVEETEYAPYGTIRERSGTVVTNYRYTGQELDMEDGLYYYVSRYYDPMIGRFISPDSIIPKPLNPQSLNPYAYCLNNPMNYTDPDGHEDYGMDGLDGLGGVGGWGDANYRESLYNESRVMNDYLGYDYDGIEMYNTYCDPGLLSLSNTERFMRSAACSTGMNNAELAASLLKKDHIKKMNTIASIIATIGLFTPARSYASVVLGVTSVNEVGIAGYETLNNEITLNDFGIKASIAFLATSGAKIQSISVGAASIKEIKCASGFRNMVNGRFATKEMGQDAVTTKAAIQSAYETISQSLLISYEYMGMR